MICVNSSSLFNFKLIRAEARGFGFLETAGLDQMVRRLG